MALVDCPCKTTFFSVDKKAGVPLPSLPDNCNLTTSSGSVSPVSEVKLASTERTAILSNYGKTQEFREKLIEYSFSGGGVPVIL